jgi:hypothetical protein
MEIGINYKLRRLRLELRDNELPDMEKLSKCLAVPDMFMMGMDGQVRRDGDWIWFDFNIERFLTLHAELEQDVPS